MKGQILALTARVAVTEDLEALVAMLQSQLQAAHDKNAVLEQSLQAQAEQMQKALSQASLEQLRELEEKQR